MNYFRLLVQITLLQYYPHILYIFFIETMRVRNIF